MSELKVKLNTDETISNALTMAQNQQLNTPLLERFLKLLTASNLDTYSTDFPAILAAGYVAVAHQSQAVSNADAAELKLRKRIAHYFNALNDHISDGDYPPHVRKYFGMEIETGIHHKTNSVRDLLAVAARIATGDASMVAAGYTQMQGFTAASVALLLAAFKTMNGIKKNAKIALIRSNQATKTMRPKARATARQVQLEVENNYNHLPPKKMRTFTVLWGLSYVKAKVKTDIKVICFLPDGVKMAAMTDLRIGQILTASGKPAKEGVKGMADAEGSKILSTVLTGKQYVNARLQGCDDIAIPITIKAGIKLTITVRFVKGKSSL
jgi:hypothetical protein